MQPAVVNLAGLPNLFGVCVYSFMCHHSLPSLGKEYTKTKKNMSKNKFSLAVTPISRKRKLSWLLLTDYMVRRVHFLRTTQLFSHTFVSKNEFQVILSFYFLLTFTGIFTFSEINDLYTLNFQPKAGEEW